MHARIQPLALAALAVLAATWLTACAVAAPPSAARPVRSSPASASSVPVRIAVFGDANAGSDIPPPVLAATFAGMRSRGAVVAWSTGDFVDDLGDVDAAGARTRWDGYLAVEGAGLTAYMPVRRTAGDNDRLDRPLALALWNELFPALPTTPDPERRWYSRTGGGIHAIFLNTAYADHMGSLGYVSESSVENSVQARWLVRDLRAATASRGRSTIVVVTHYPLLGGKTTKPFAGERQAEATALRALFAKYGVDLVVSGDTHVFRRTMVRVVKNGVAHRVPYVQLPPAASVPRSFGVAPLTALGRAESGWAPDQGSRGFVQVRYDVDDRRFRLTVFRVGVADGAVSNAETLRANANPLGGTFADVPEGCRVP